MKSLSSTLVILSLAASSTSFATQAWVPLEGTANSAIDAYFAAAPKSIVRKGKITASSANFAVVGSECTVSISSPGKDADKAPGKISIETNGGGDDLGRGLVIGSYSSFDQAITQVSVGRDLLSITAKTATQDTDLVQHETYSIARKNGQLKAATYKGVTATKTGTTTYSEEMTCSL